MNLEGRTALVTGAGKGIGRAIAVALAASGADVIINYCGSEAGALETERKCQEYGVKTLVIRADIANAEDVDNMLKQALTLTGRIDILVNNAGITRDNIMLSMKEEEFRSVIDTNLVGTYYCTKAVLRTMLKQKYGRIISLSSVVGLAGNAGQANYAASKAGIIGLTKSLAKEMASRNITVNAIAPGMIETEMTAAVTDAAREKMLAAIAAGRMGSPEDVANAAVFFAAEESGYVTGQVLRVDGGMSI